MTNQQKQKIARLVAENVWGWEQRDFQYGNEWHTSWFSPDGRMQETMNLSQEVFSWPGFGRTFERMIDNSFRLEIGRHGILWWIHNSDRKKFGTNRGDLIEACHLAAIDSLGS